MQMPGRTYTATNQYRYGYQGSEKDKELNTNTYNTFFREIDTRIGRWWSIDPKASAFESPYVIMRNNPIWFNDIRGDSIPAKFYTPDGQATNEIPSVVQNQYQQEYGITLGYANGKLYKAGDFNTDKTVSKDAKAEWENLLGSENSDKNIVFGFNMALSIKPTLKGDLDNPVRMGQWVPLQNTAFIDLADFDNNGLIKGIGINGPPGGLPLSTTSRIDNLARVIEHEYLCHGIKGLDLGANHGVTQENPLGQSETLLNKYRSQMGVPLRVSYGYSTAEWTKPNVRTMVPVKHNVSRNAVDRSGNTYGQFYETTSLEVMKRLYSWQ